MAKIVLSIKERLMVADVLRDLLIDNHDGTWSYANGWTDERIAEKVGGRTKINHVYSIRVQAFGPFPKPKPMQPANTVSERLALLEDRFAKLEQALAPIL